jgi:hypothetical protein
MTIKKNGGMYFWSAGKLGGSFYVKRHSKCKALVIYRPPFTGADFALMMLAIGAGLILGAYFA